MILFYGHAGIDAEIAGDLSCGCNYFNMLNRFAKRDAQMRQCFHHMIFGGSHRNIEGAANVAIRHLVEPGHAIATRIRPTASGEAPHGGQVQAFPSSPASTGLREARWREGC